MFTAGLGCPVLLGGLLSLAAFYGAYAFMAVRAALGKVDAAWINRALQMPFFSVPPPKSLDRNDFRAWVAEHAGLGDR